MSGLVLRRWAALWAALFLTGCAAPAVQELAAPPLAARQEAAASPASPAPSLAPSPLPAAEKATTALRYRAVWVSYLEWQQVDFTSETAFAAEVDAMLDNCAALGATVILAQVRPFCDALYPSALFPFSHLCTGEQGRSPGFDPLAVLVAAAHARGLQLEAWLNPYRVQAGSLPPALAAENPARLHPEWAVEAAGGLYLDPASPEVQRYIAAGVRELCENYDVDGIHFDDYFYPTADPAFDAASYTAYTQAGGVLELADWRRQNVDALVALCYRTVHEFSGVRFGISPQGNRQNNYDAQYSDAARWLAVPGYVDYLTPQIYWGMHYQKNGSTEFSFAECAGDWLALPRHEGAALYFGLGAFRIGEGDGSDAAASQNEWYGGRALAGQARWLAQAGADGFALYRYASLFEAASPALAVAERKNLSEVIFGL